MKQINSKTLFAGLSAVAMSLAAAFAASAQDQYYMYVVKKNSVKIPFKLSDIDSVYFSLEKYTVEPEYVDLGLSVNWATFNVGASFPEDYGNYYAWGETQGKNNYDRESCKWLDAEDTAALHKYDIRGENGRVSDKTVLDLEDDVAHTEWGGAWRMPTSEEFDELIQKCTWTWTTQNGVNGSLVTSKKTGNSIFLPAAGLRDGSTSFDEGTGGCYWSSSLSANESYCAFALGVGWGYLALYQTYWYSGLPVRPVVPSETWVPDVVSVFLSNDSIGLKAGEAFVLTTTVKLDDEIVNYEVLWASDNPSVATVDEQGTITAVGTGTAIITATCNGQSASCTINVIPAYKYVDLGLSVNWATFNVGAAAPEEYGDYYAWGETETKDDYSWETYKWGNGSINATTKYCTSSSYGTVDNKIVLESEDDVAHVKWGGKWRMPTDAEWTELRENCTWTWTDNYNGTGVAGGVVTSNVEGYENKSIFLPVAGRELAGISANYDAGSDGYYWSSSLYTDFPGYAWYVSFYSDNVRRNYYNRYYGQSIRPVCPSNFYVNKTSLDFNGEGGPDTLVIVCSAGFQITTEASWLSIEKTATGAIITAQSNPLATSRTAEITVQSVGLETEQSATISVSQSAGHQYVDLGLSVKWATCNVGATAPEEYGEYYAWGEIETKSNYNDETYKWCNGSISLLTKYCTSSDYGTVDNKTVLESEDDVAHVKWGGVWRMPTLAELSELRTGCTWTWTTQNGVNGYLVTSNKDGFTDRSIFLPAAGYHAEADLWDAGSHGYYWSSSLTENTRTAYCLIIQLEGVYRSSFDRGKGISVRPVCP